MAFPKYKSLFALFFLLASLSFGVNAVEIPARIEAEDYSSMNAVRTGATTDTSGGSFVGWIRNGAYTEYDITVASSGTYTVVARVSSATDGGTIDFRINGASVGSVDVGNTGGWQDFTNEQSTLDLPEGDHTLQLFYTGANNGFLPPTVPPTVPPITESNEPTREGDWVFCANENEVCDFVGTKEVAYGDGENWFYSEEENGVNCTNGTFGDPIRGTVKSCFYNESGPSLNQPNILLVMSDDQGIDASAQYDFGNDLPNTPVIDSLAQNGIVYENVWAAPSCTPTRAALLSGKHGVHTGVLSVPGELAADEGTIHQFLSENATSSNYETAVFGHLRANITDYFDWTITTNGVEEQSTTYHTTELVNQTLDWIEEQQQNPWFAWVAFAAPHTPYHAPPEEFNTRGLSGTQADINANERTYFLSSIETMDAELGRLLESMDPATRDNTVIIVVGDNGTPRDVLDNEAFLAGHQKGSLFEGGVRVPLVISGAGVTRTNVREEGLISVVDFFPTIAALTGIENDGIHDGYNFLSSFSAEDEIDREYLYTDYFGNNALGRGWTVRSATHKYIDYDDGTEALYDLVADPDEATDILSTNGAIAAELRAFGLEVRGEE